MRDATSAQTTHISSNLTYKTSDSWQIGSWKGRALIAAQM